ncbi:DUF3488 and transglutaminase-like domain-containing protein [Streptomonospora sp. S1-112]|uniref:DUF3488 and transglutaminase-like domain-containing protein n=1 Tax=Streptomonospora mangrovi TaxID=2883123 RepID=A0A9X3NN18_9ACTN|nr:transglutaminase domain-containing protein [Streptomonospora mangrovi]MDA0566749.1 DUF3488 and transglutaminase-like domain-containing protein [Streptomonospora mangrovi]
MTATTAPSAGAPAPPGRPARRPGPRPRALVAAAGLVLATAAGGVALAPGYAQPGVLYAVLPACAVASVAVALLLRRRTTAFRTVLAGLPLPLAAVLAAAAWLPGEGTGVLGGAGEALLHSGARILTSTAPTPLSVDTLTLPLLATWLAGTAAALAWRARRPSLALLPGLLLLVGAVVLNGPAAPPGFPAIGMLAVAAAALMAVPQPAPGTGGADDAALTVEVEAADARARASGLRRAATTAVITVVVAALTVFGGPALLAGWDAEPGDPRTALTPPMAPQAALNPLSYLSGWAADPDESLLTVTAEEPVDLRWVVLGEFTGTTWLPEGGYRAAGQTLPAPVPPPPHAAETTARIAVGDDLPGNWAPVVGAPQRVELSGLGYDPVTGTVVRREGDLAGAEYRVTGQVPDWRAGELAGAATPAEEVFDRYRDLPEGAPPVLNQIVAAVAAEGAPYQRATAIAEYLRESHSFDPETPGGHGYANVAAILAPPGEKGGGGTSEQFASAFAMLARAAGLPSRVAVGFGPGTDEGEGRYSVQTGDAVAWGEVYFEGVGWVPFSVTPGGEDGEDAGTAPQSAPEPQDAEEDSRDDPDSDTHDVSAPPRERGGSGPWAALLWSGGGLLALLLAVPAARLARGARRLRAGTPERRVLGAWRELRDGLRQSGADLPPGSTVGDTLAAARDLLPESARAGAQADLDRLGHAVNGVGFAEGPAVDAAAAARVADGVRRCLRLLRAGRDRRKRLTWWFDPRPLFWRTP